MGITQLEVLCGWKQIADYLGMGVRTVQRYERDLGLPIRRPAGGGTFRGAVIATKVELDAWITASPLRKAFRLSLHDGDTPDRIKELRQQLADLHRLREETASLQREMIATGKKLEQSIASLFESVRFAIGEQRARQPADVLPLDDPKKRIH